MATALSLEALPPAGAWHQSLTARAVLAECVATPPKGEWQRERYTQTTDEHYVYTGPQADTLRSIWHGVGDAAMAYGDRTGDYAPMREWFAAPTVEAAIDAVLA